MSGTLPRPPTPSWATNNWMREVPRKREQTACESAEQRDRTPGLPNELATRNQTDAKKQTKNPPGVITVARNQTNVRLPLGTAIHQEMQWLKGEAASSSPPTAMQTGQQQTQQQRVPPSPHFSFGPHLIYSPANRAGSVERIQEVLELNWGK